MATTTAVAATAAAAAATRITQKTIGQNIHGISHIHFHPSYKYQSILYTFGQNENTIQSKNVYTAVSI